MPTQKKHTSLVTPELGELLFKSPKVEEDQLNWKIFGKALLNASQSSIFVVDRIATVIISNELARKKLGLFPGSLLTSTMSNLWPYIQKNFQNKNNRESIFIKIKETPYLALLTPVTHKDSTTGMLCILEDHTELHNVTRRMISYQELSQELDALVDFSSDGLWICDGNANVLKINKASERINDVRSDDVVGSNMSDLVKNGFVDRSVTLDVLKSRKSKHILQENRSGRKLILTGNPVFNEKDEIIRVVVTERDITEIDNLRHKLEEQVTIKDLMRHQMLEMQLGKLKSQQIIARSPAMINVFKQALKLSQFDTTVLILGESGSGKGVIANLIYRHSPRSDHPMIRINCGAIPETLVETELFGYDKGAFTGADRKGKPGHLELADGGMIFLDEIAELPMPSQVKLLRFLENGRITRVGSTKSRQLDVRILGATHRNLESMVKDGTFRQDLFYRLNVVPISVPPLRDRKECILPLIQYYLEYFAYKLKRKKKPQISRKAMNAMITYNYPGNVRELMNLCERLVVMAEKGWIDLNNLPTNIISMSDDLGKGLISDLKEGKTLAQMIETVEQRILEDAKLKYGTQKKIAKALSVNQSTIARKLRKYK